MAGFILVSGAWHGGWCWERVVPMLTEAGIVLWLPISSGRDQTLLRWRR
jgi:hypothetical protein